MPEIDKPKPNNWRENFDVGKSYDYLQQSIRDTRQEFGKSKDEFVDKIGEFRGKYTNSLNQVGQWVPSMGMLRSPRNNIIEASTEVNETYPYVSMVCRTHPSFVTASTAFAGALPGLLTGSRRFAFYGALTSSLVAVVGLGLVNYKWNCPDKQKKV